MIGDSRLRIEDGFAGTEALQMWCRVSDPAGGTESRPHISGDSR
jgi:hypothetical protein